MNVCACKWISDQQIQQALKQGYRTIADLSLRLGIGLECGRCLDKVHELLQAGLADLSPVAVDTTPQPTSVDTALVASAPAASSAAAPTQAAWFMIDP